QALRNSALIPGHLYLNLLDVGDGSIVVDLQLSREDVAWIRRALDKARTGGTTQRDEVTARRGQIRADVVCLADGLEDLARQLRRGLTSIGEIIFLHRHLLHGNRSQRAEGDENYRDEQLDER